ncbi:hypothetical protein EGX98_04905 [Fusobacterium necrophorum]|uniref:Uncharacterized protein n=1 Tax=Fusobacterium necrophorum BL TaxID=1441732 RepID=A0AB73BWZ2_9FUSO|nr:hypothetical protein [Fusobacterium necrophorum]KDE63793.1 hypothetical protein FUSO3_04495 [Fusobacterium necrophorum BL]KDE74613.1 hypothetical protein FUSO7_01970 [Fusobacterium necrophorum BFTR-2]AYZ73434.1 hypothetical protein EGX98_04905 [Fusobacterium necrophorum]AZW08569.1 hypothetical protein EO219_02520 [Fusobacterium necrophorum subsp. necrophorum]SDB41122.1 hypothetical protein SAMN02983009_01970 [Fusobacterium necrophorum]
MVKVEFHGSVEEVKNEMVEFVGSWQAPVEDAEFISRAVGDIPVVEEPKKTTIESVKDEAPTGNWTTCDCKEVPKTEAPAPAAPVVPTVPVAPATEYTFADIQRIAAPLVHQGKSAELINALGNFGVKAITELQQDQFGAFILELKNLGADV